MTTAPWWAVAAAAVPLIVLGAMVFATKRSLTDAAWLSAVVTALLAALLYDLDAPALWQALAKGSWTGTWIVVLVVPALAVFEVSQKSGALHRLGEGLQSMAPGGGRQLLLLAWILPSFLQGVAGFGVPIVIAAPLLVQAGFTPVAATAACVVGYHWSVTFGSMGSSFFIAAGTAQLDADDTVVFALKAAGLLVVNALVAGALLLRRVSGRWKRSCPVWSCSWSWGWCSSGSVRSSLRWPRPQPGSRDCSWPPRCSRRGERCPTGACC